MVEDVDEFDALRLAHQQFTLKLLMELLAESPRRMEILDKVAAAGTPELLLSANVAHQYAALVRMMREKLADGDAQAEPAHPRSTH